MATESPMEDLEWLNGNRTLEQLMERYPEAWAEAGSQFMEVGNSVLGASTTGKAQTLNQVALAAKASAETWKDRVRRSRKNPKVIAAAVPQIAKSRMILLALSRGYLAAAAGTTTGKVRFSMLNGIIIQILLFERHFTRKPVGMKWFKFWWRLVTQKTILMPLVQDKGIYCFYSADLISELCALIDGRPCLEIAAGDGTLARFLQNRGESIIATDDRSWKNAIEYPDNVENLSARAALSRYKLPVVICSWPPPGNSFEHHVFSSPWVVLYIVIASRHQFVSGNWNAYSQQNKFDWAIDEHLSNLVIPPNSGNAVIVFRRKNNQQSDSPDNKQL